MNEIERAIGRCTGEREKIVFYNREFLSFLEKDKTRRIEGGLVALGSGSIPERDNKVNINKILGSPKIDNDSKQLILLLCKRHNIDSVIKLFTSPDQSKICENIVNKISAKKATRSRA